MKYLISGIIAFTFLALPDASFACSLQTCIGNGVEMRREFVVHITHGDKPLGGVTVRVSTLSQEKPVDLFSGTTSAGGDFFVADLAPGNYSLDTDMLGISAGGGCFHVDLHSSRKAKSKMIYEWGDLVPAVRKAGARLINSQVKQGGSWPRDQIDIPIIGIRVKLQDPFTGRVYETTSNQDGYLSMDAVPDGLYAIHVDGGIAPDGLDYESVNYLVRLDARSKLPILFSRSPARFGGCGGTSLDLFGHPTRSTNPNER